MRVPPSARVAAALVLLVSGCPKSPTKSSPSLGQPDDGPRIRKLARILRASDRRLVDEDISALLRDEDAAVRSRAALALGQIADPSSLPDLETVANDAEAEPRASAAFAMGLIADASQEAALEKLAADPSPIVRAAAVEALGRLHDAAGVSAVRPLLDDVDMHVRAAAALAAWKFEDPEPLLDPLLANLGSNDPDVRRASAYAVARLVSATTAPPSSGAPVGRLSAANVERSRAALAQRVTDVEPEVRMQVARGLALPRSGMELAVVGTLTQDRHAGVRVSAVRSLGYPGVAIKPYLDRTVGDSDQSVARAAIEAVGAIGGPAADGLLYKLLQTLEKGWLRDAALTALARNESSKKPEIVAGLLKNPDPEMRAVAAPLLAGRKEPAAIAASAALLHDAEPRVQAVAVPVVSDQEGPLGTLLAGLFGSPDPVVRAAVAEALGGRFSNARPAFESGDDLFAHLEEIWAHSNADTIPDAKLAVVDAVAKAGNGDRTRAALTRALTDPDSVVRRRAAARFKEVFAEDRSRDVGPASDRPLSDYERIARWSLVSHVAVISVRRPGSSTGRFMVAIDASAAPMAAWNFSELAGKKFFDGATLHRVVPNFVVQDGDPRGDGFGGPGYSIRDEFNPLPFTAGVLGMASDGKDTAGSQWFIALSAQPHLDGRYTSFGRVTQGLREIVSQMRKGDTVESIRVYEENGTQAFPRD